VDILITVGRLGRIIGKEAQRWGLPSDKVHLLDEGSQAIELLKAIIAPNDVVLIKGSRAVHLEEVVMALARPVWEIEQGS
jgi:UDP-N-acetylmuramoyl-tripeptide--D-alanyl-D-alanine ligase